MPIELYELCPLCGSENLKKKFNINGYTLTTCISCSLQFIQEKISDEFLQNYYSNLFPIYQAKGIIWQRNLFSRSAFKRLT